MNIQKLIAERMSKIDSSGIRKVFDLAEDIPEPINLSIGQPDFDVPEPVKAKAMRAIERGENKYTVTQGTEELRADVLEYEKRMAGVQDGKALITSGVSGGLLLAFMALINEGDEIAIPDPYFVMYKHLVRLIGGSPLYVDTYPDFQLTVDNLETACADRAKILLLNSPNNPTGQVIPENELEKIADWAEENDVFVISDEIYRPFVYEGNRTSIAKYMDDFLLLNGFSKGWAMTGWRLGYAVGPTELIDEMTKLQQFTFVCAPSMAQHAGLTALSISIDDYIQAYKAKRDLLCHELGDNFELQIPGGAFYAFLRAPDDDGDAFVAEAIKHSCLVIPGSVFSERSSHFRISFAASDREIERGAQVLCSLV